MEFFSPASERRGLSCHRLLYSVGLIPLCGKTVTSGVFFLFCVTVFHQRYKWSQAFASSMGLSLLTPVTSMLISDSSNILCLFLPVGN